MEERKKIIFLFDVDGTLTPARQKAPPEIIKMLKNLRSHVYTGFVGGSDLMKQQEQMGSDVLDVFEYGFPENGVVYYKNGTLVSEKSIIEVYGEEKYHKFVNYCLEYISKLKCKKRGTFIELRRSMVNLSPIGRNCTQSERNEFFEQDKNEGIKEKMRDDLTKKFGPELQVSVGGQISVDVFPSGWDKTYCLQHLSDFEKIIFFGDKIKQGGNDFEIFNHPRVDGHEAIGPEGAVNQVKKVLKEVLNVDLEV